MLLLSPKSTLVAVLCCCFAGAGLLEAKPSRLGDLGDRSALEEARFVSPMKTPELNSTLSGQRIEFGQWHGSFSSIGGKRAGVTTDSRSTLQQQMASFPMVERKNANIAVDAAERQMASMRNVDQVREMVLARQYADITPKNVQSRTLQDMVDEVSLKDINRFQVHRNKTDDGIPMQRAGSGEAPTVQPKRERTQNAE